MRKALLGVALALWLTPTAHAALRTRIVYASGWSGSMELYAVDPSTRGPLGQITTGTEPFCAPTAIPCGFIDPIPSPDGRRILFRGATFGLGSFRMGLSSLWLARANGTDRVRLVAASTSSANTGLQGEPAWSPDSRKIAYASSGDIHVVDADGRNDRVLASGIAGDVAWSRDGRSLFVLASNTLYVIRNGIPAKLVTDAGCGFALSPNARWVAVTTCFDSQIRLIRVFGHRRPELVLGRGVEPVWSPNGRRLAFQGSAGITVYELKTQRIRVLTRDPLILGRDESEGTGLAWSPDGRSVAYVTGSMQTFADAAVRSGDLRVVTLDRKVHTVVSSTAGYGGRIVGVSWTRVPAGMRYPRPEPVPSAVTTKDSFLADGPIEHLAADGSHIAFVACDQISTWTPGAAAATRTLAGCRDRDRYSIYDIALAGDQLLYAEMFGCNSINQDVSLRSLDPAVVPIRVASGQGSCGGPFHAVGRLVGSGNFLAFSNWQEVGDYTSSSFGLRTVAQSVSRVGLNGCPCPELASSPGPLVPADVDGGRLVVYGTNETEVFDSNGHKLLSVAVSPLAAQLTGSDLILVLQGELRDVDANTGMLRHAWTLPDVWTGPSCSFHCGATANCWYACAQYTLTVQDAAPGLISYTLYGEVHVQRLSDGRDKVVGRGTLARFMDSGLVYADGARLHLVPLGELFR